MCFGGSTIPRPLPLPQRSDADLQKLVSELSPGGERALAKPEAPVLPPITGGRDIVQYERRNQAQAEHRRALAAYEAQQKELGDAQRLLEFRRIARERTALSAQQQTDMQRLQEQQAQAAADQERQVAALRLQEEQQQQQLAASRLATNAATTSLRVLQTPQAKAPTAAMTKAPGTAAQRRRASSTELRIGSGATAPGVGLNIGG